MILISTTTYQSCSYRIFFMKFVYKHSGWGVTCKAKDILKNIYLKRVYTIEFNCFFIVCNEPITRKLGHHLKIQKGKILN